MFYLFTIARPLEGQETSPRMDLAMCMSVHGVIHVTDTDDDHSVIACIRTLRLLRRLVQIVSRPVAGTAQLRGSIYGR